MLFAPRLRGLGCDVTLSAFWGLRGGVLTWDGIRVLPGHVDPYSNDVLVDHARHTFGGDPRAGLVVTLTDVWVLRPQVLSELNVAAWVPVDHEPCHEMTVDALREGGCVPVAMSRHGERMLRDAKLDPVYVPHGFDGRVFHPADRGEARRRLGFPKGAFVVAVVAANQSMSPCRKSFPELLEAFRRFRLRHRGQGILYLHTRTAADLNGLDLSRLMTKLGVRPSWVRIANQYRYMLGFPPAYLADVYNAADVLLNPAMGEGFGVPIIEAQAAGCPVIVSDFSSMPELCGAGWKVAGRRVYTPFESWQHQPDVDAIEAALESAFEARGDERLREQAAAFAADYDADRVTDTYWRPALAEITRRCGLDREQVAA